MTSMVKTAGPALGLVLVLLLAGEAWGRDSLSGAWREDYSETIVSVEQWSPACGTTPKTIGRQKRGLAFEIEDRGIDLVFSGKSGRFSSVDCQTRNKAVKPKERTVKDNLFMISCSTKEDASTYENGLYSFRIKGPKKIEYRETTRFSRNASGSMCVHTKRIQRAYSKQAEAPKLAEPKPAPAPAPAPEPEPEPAPPPAPADPCAKPGAVVSVSIEPSRAEVAAGDQLCLEVMASDANACDVSAPLRWARDRAPRDIQLTPKGCLQISRRATLGARTLSLSAGGVQTELELVVTRPPARVARPTPDPIRAPEPAPVPEPVPAEPEPPADPEPVVEVDAGTEGAAPVEPEEEPSQAADGGILPAPQDPSPAPGPATPSSPAKADAQTSSGSVPIWIWASAGAGALVLVVIVLIVVLSRRRRNAAQAGLDVEPVTPTARTVDEMAASFGVDDGLDASASPGPAEASLVAGEGACVQCGEALPPGAEFCTGCGTRTMADDAPTEMDGGPAEPATDGEGEVFCTNCGQKVPAVARFCPFCATKLG